jgi:Flp pilus assembly protein TadD
MCHRHFGPYMSASLLASRPLRHLLLLAPVLLALGACTGRGGIGATTGSLGTQPQMSEAQWRAQIDTLAQRYEANPKNRVAIIQYARGLRALGQHAQALAILQQGVLAAGEDNEMLGLYGRTLADAGQFKEAQDVLSRAHTPERPDWRILSAQGTVSDQIGDHDGAQRYYETALRIVPGEPSVMSNLGLSYALSKRLPQAEQTLRSAAADPRADVRVRQNLVLVLGLQGKFADAETVARQDQSPAEAQASVAQLRRVVSQPNSWDLLKGGNPGARPVGAKPAAARASAGNKPVTNAGLLTPQAQSN